MGFIEAARTYCCPAHFLDTNSRHGAVTVAVARGVWDHRQETTTMPPRCPAAHWTITLVARRAADVTFVVSSSANLYRVYDSRLGAPTCVKAQFGVPAGGWLQLAWLPQPGATAPLDPAANALKVLTATRRRVAVPLSAVSVVVATTTPHTPHGAALTYTDIGVAPAPVPPPS